MGDPTSPEELKQTTGDPTRTEQSAPPVERLPEGQESREAYRLTDELLDALVSVPDFKDKASRAYAHGSDSVVFSHDGKDYRFSKVMASVDLEVGEPGAFEWGSGKGWEEKINIAKPWTNNWGFPVIREFAVQFGSKDVFEVPYADSPENHQPQTNTTLAVQNIERIIQTLKPVQAPTPPP